MLNVWILAGLALLVSGSPIFDKDLVEFPDETDEGSFEDGGKLAMAPAFTEVGNANSFVDLLLENVKKNPDVQIEPFLIPERSLGFEKKFFLITYKGEMKIKDGILTGLSTIHRTGDCSMVYDRNVMHVKVRLGMGVLKAKVTGSITFMNLGPAVEASADVGFAEIEMDLAVNIVDMKPEVTKFKLDTLKGLSVKISGLGPLDYLFNFFSDLNAKLFRNTFKFITEQVMAAIVKNQLKNMKIPL